MQKKTSSKNSSSQMDSILMQPVEKIFNLTPRRLELFRQMDIFTAYDLLHHFPRKYEDWRSVCRISDVSESGDVTIRAEVARMPSLHRKGKFSVLRTTLFDESGSISAVWFNQPYYKTMLEKGQSYLFFGSIKKNKQNIEMMNPAFQSAKIDADESLRPVYKTVKGISQKVLRDYKKKLLFEMMGKYAEPIPDVLIKKNKLCSAEFAYQNIHFPLDKKALSQARSRLAYEELFMLISGLMLLKKDDHTYKNARKVVLTKNDAKWIKKSIDALPFELTSDQKNVINDILKDMSRARPMNRLIQGDVGSGKTLVAAVSMYACALKGFQSVFLVPTSVLAQQHYRVIKDFFKNSEDMGVDLLLGGTKEKERTAIRQRLRDGQTKILVGTHAVLLEKDSFNNLTLLVTDEQHRFGVRQRATLKKNNEINVHTLVMSATPIPRTLGLILYANMDLSVISQRPAGRQNIETYLVRSTQIKRIVDIAKRQIDAGRQVYYVCPMIEDEEDEGLPAAQEVFNRFSKDLFKNYRVGLLHGAQKASEKDDVMNRFSEGRVDLLVSTTVIEVGVDNPNASLMIIDHAESFGLSTLHQLRGRIGRGIHRSVCILISDTENEKSMDRLRYLCAQNDGFALAQKDLETRGPGDFFGAAQHGLPQMQFAHFYTNMTEVASTARDIESLLQANPNFDFSVDSDWTRVFEQKFRRQIDYTSL